MAGRSNPDDLRSCNVLLLLANWLSEHIRTFNVLNYITLRAVLATLTSLGIGLYLGPWVILQTDRAESRPGGAR